MPEQISSLFASHTQTTRLLRLTTPLGPHTLLAECVHGEEAISQAFTFKISALSLDAHLPLRKLIGQPAFLKVLTINHDVPRTFHGYVAAIDSNGADGGMARYTLILQPWFAFLGHTRDSRIFQDMTVLDILDAVFRTWQNRGSRLVPAWRFDLIDSTIYPKRSLTTQYQESDLAFVERLMNEEGLFYFFEHEADEHAPQLGKHQMIIADHNGAFSANSQPRIRFTTPGAVMKEDSMDRWRRKLCLQTNAIELRSWDYRSLKQRPVSSTGAQTKSIELADRDMPGQYAYFNRTHGQRIADRQIQGLEACCETFVGAGTVRTLSPGRIFTLSGHAVHDEENDDSRRFLTTRVVHLMHNNFSPELDAQIVQRIGANLDFDKPFNLLTDKTNGGRPLYRNRIDAIRASLPYRSSRTDRCGRVLYPRPTILGQQSAVVVGPPDAFIHTDRDHRIKVQFHWQRDADIQMSHNRLSHPYPEGQIGAAGDDSVGTWVRVVTSLGAIAGTNWGSHSLPRVGQEVLVDFLEGNIDRPVIIGALYNGMGITDAQHNKINYGAGVATGNAPTWFPGEKGGHGHPAALCGLKSQTMQTSQIGTGSFSQLRFDDNPGQASVALQRHAYAHRGTAELNLGKLRHQIDNQRLHSVGFGAELKTEHSLALRAANGLLLATDPCNSSSRQWSISEALKQIDLSSTLQENLATTAQKHNAQLKNSDGQAQQQELAAIVEIKNNTVALDEKNGTDTNANAKPQIQLSSPKGISAVTSVNAIMCSNKTTNISAGQDINFSAGKNSILIIKSGISLFTYGKANNKDKPNQETGLALRAALGKATAQSQSGPTNLIADKTITVASITKSVVVSAPKHLLMAAQGACLKIESGNIMVHAPGKIEFKASMKELSEPIDAHNKTSSIPKTKEIYNEAFVVTNEDTKEPMGHVRYRLESSSGVKIDGITDAFGRTQRIFTERSERLTLYLPKEE